MPDVFKENEQIFLQITNDLLFAALDNLIKDDMFKTKIITELKIARDMLIDNQTKFNPETNRAIYLIHDTIVETLTKQAE